MNVKEFREVMLEDINLSAAANNTSKEVEFLLYVTNILSEGDEFDDFIESYYEGVSNNRANMQIDGYALDETDGSCCIIISDFRGLYGNESLLKDDIDRAFKKIRYFVEESINGKLYRNLEESTVVYEFSRYISENFHEITKFRFYLLSDVYNKQKLKNIKDTMVNNKTVELNVWDASRLFDIVSSKTKKESVEIIFKEMDYSGIPCVKAVDYRDVIADIDIFGTDKEEQNNKVTYTSYLAVVPGGILNRLYIDYGSRLLEGNVRSFLSVRGKVNKSIQNTIKNYPEMFFAYNNGIAATATEIDCEMHENGLLMTRIKGLQIVNGGQTTASIANTLLTAKKDENIDLSSLYVPMKISVLRHEEAEQIIPKISEYSNSQNKVDASDFFSNHPFHIRIEEYSRKTPAPAINGNQFQQYWFYERTKGQYNQGKMRYKPKSVQIKQYETRYPSEQVIKMIELAKYMDIYDGLPHIVSKGGQAIVKDFAETIKNKWVQGDSEFNIYYFKRLVALTIIFKHTDNVIKQTRWFKEKHSYKANVIAYTLSLIFDYIRKNMSGYSVDFLKIWNRQAVYDELDIQLRSLCTEVYHFITSEDRLTENVTEWCKRKECWERAQKQEWTMLPEFLYSLILESDIKAEEKEAKDSRRLENEIDNFKIICNAGSAYWQDVLIWGKERRLLTDLEESAIKIAINIALTGKIPSDKQIKLIIRARERMVNEGMPLQF